MNRLLRYSIGPVGSFIGEARRLRDYWAGSFLLSWLTATAIDAARGGGARILSPILPSDDARVEAMCTAQDGYASLLPNQFRAIVANDFDPSGIRQAIIDRWVHLSEAVWHSFVAPAFLGDTETLAVTRALWLDQIGSSDACFWETIWVMGDCDDHRARPDDKWMADRKRFRKPFFLGDQGPGDLCAIMPDFREISSLQRAQERQKQDAFWHAIRAHLAVGEGGTSLDLRRHERLCAPALVKRLFLRLDDRQLQETIGWVPGVRKLWASRVSPGANLEVAGHHWPSTAAVAAVPWVRQIVERALSTDDEETQGAIDQFVRAVRGYDHALSVAERQSRFWEPVTYMKGAKSPRRAVADVAGLLQADGRLFFENELDVVKLEDGAPDEGQRAKVDAIKTALRDLRKTCCDNASASPYYAVLRMDADQVGVLKNRIAEHAMNGTAGLLPLDLQNSDDPVGACLTEFIEKARVYLSDFEPIEGQDFGPRIGDPVYASADELVIIAPVDRVATIHRAMRDLFAKTVSSRLDKTVAEMQLDGGPRRMTISAAIVFAQYKAPLGRVLREAEERLEFIKGDRERPGQLCLSRLEQGAVSGRWELRKDTILDDLISLAEGKSTGPAIWGTNHATYGLLDTLRYLQQSEIVCWQAIRLAVSSYLTRRAESEDTMADALAATNQDVREISDVLNKCCFGDGDADYDAVTQALLFLRFFANNLPAPARQNSKIPVEA